MSYRSTISRSKLEHNRAAKAPTNEEILAAMEKHPTDPFAAAVEAQRLASERIIRNLRR